MSKTFREFRSSSYVYDKDDEPYFDSRDKRRKQKPFTETTSKFRKRNFKKEVMTGNYDEDE